MAKSIDENLMALQFKTLLTYETNQFFVDEEGRHQPYRCTKQPQKQFAYLYNGEVVATSNKGVECPDDVKYFTVLTYDKTVHELLLSQQDGRWDFSHVEIDIDGIDWERYRGVLSDVKFGLLKRVPVEINYCPMEFLYPNDYSTVTQAYFKSGPMGERNHRLIRNVIKGIDSVRVNFVGDDDHDWNMRRHFHYDPLSKV